MTRAGLPLVVVVVVGAAGIGCFTSLEEQTKKSPNSIIGKKTQDIGEYDPQAGKAVQDGKVRADDPILYPLQAYGPIMQQVSTLAVDAHVAAFYAEHGRYPQDHAEFMEKIIKANNVQLPVLPGKMKYQYDVTNHKLVVIDPNAPAAPHAAAPAQAAEQPPAPTSTHAPPQP